MNQNTGIPEYPNTRTVIDHLEFIGSPDKSFTYLTTSLPITSNFLNLCGSLTFSFLYLFLFPLLFLTPLLQKIRADNAPLAAAGDKLDAAGWDGEGR